MALTTAQQTDAYRFFAIAFGAAPGVEFMNQIALAYEGGANTKQVVNEFVKKSQFTNTYPIFLTNEQFANRLIDNVVGSSADDAAKTEAKADVVSALAGGATRGDVIFQVFSNLASLSGDAKWGNVATKLANQVEVARYYTETLLRSSTDLATLQAVLTGVNESTTVTAAALEARLNPPAAGQTFTLTTGIETITGSAGNDTINATVATLNALDVINGGAGTDTLNIRDSASILTQPATISAVETVNVTSTAGSVGRVGSSSATIAVAEQVKFNFDPATYGTSVGAGPVTVTVGGASITVGTSGSSQTLQDLAAAIQTLLGGSTGLGTATGPSATTGAITVTSAVPGTALPSITFANGTYTAPGSATATATNTTIDVAAATNYSFKETVVANQAAAAAVASSTFFVPAGATTVAIDSAADARVTSVSTAATTVAAGGAVILSGGASQTVTTFDSIQVSGGVGPIVANALSVPATALAGVSGTGWTAGAGVFIRGGTTVSITETAGSSTSGSVPNGNTTKITVGANPANATGVDSGTSVITNALTGAQTIGNLSSAPTGDVTIVVRTNYTGNNTTNTATNGLTNVVYGGGAADIWMNGGTTASITGAGTVNVTDLGTILRKASTTADSLPGTSKLNTVNLTGVSGATAIRSDAMSAISAVDTSSTITVNSNTGANTGSIALNVANSTVTLSHANATSVAIGSAAGSGRQAIGNTPIASTQDSTVTLTAANATALSLSGANSVTLAGSTLPELTSITSTASGTTALGTVTGYAKLTSVNLSGATGAASASLGTTITGASTDRGFAYTGSQGADTVTLTGTMRSGTSSAGAVINNTINLGAGNDTLLSNGSGVIAAGAVVDGGDGLDTIAASLITAGNAAQIRNFELLGLDGTSKDVDLLVGAQGLVAIAHGGTYTNVKKSQPLSVATNVGAGTTTLTFATAEVAGAADAYTISFAARGATTLAGASTINAGTYSISGIENVTISSGQSSGFVKNAITLTAANLKTVTLTGSASESTLAFVGANGTNTSTGGGVSSIDASAATGKVIVNTTNLTVDNATGFAGLTVATGSGDDTITLAQFAIVNTGGGTDVVVVSAAGATITKGSGKDTVRVELATSATPLVTVTDFAAGDTIDFINGTNGTHSATANAVKKLTLTTESSLADAIASAINDDTAAAGADVVWFQYGGNTYIVYDASGGTGLYAAGDVVVKLNGVIDLTNATFDATNGSFTLI